MRIYNRNIFTVGLLALLLVGLGAMRASAQDITGTIVGLVKDAGGAVVSGATVTIKDIDKNVVVRTVTTNSDGAYSAPLLLVGRYSLSVEASGFKKFVRNNIEVNVNDRLTVDANLEVGRVEEEVVVETAPLEVELQTATQGGLVTGREIRELPLNNRNYLQLLTLQPGVSSGASDQLYIGTTNPAGQVNTVQFAINGGRTSQNSYTIDGADNLDRGSNMTLLNFPSVDSIAEFKVLRNHYSAEYGRSAVGQVNVVTRSGGKEFHGGAYEFFRNDILNAGSFFDNARAPLGLDGDGKARRPPLRYNNFGYTLGGPALIPGPTKDKLFFFFSQEFRRVITGANVQAQVPTAGERQGVFAVPVCVAVSGNTCTQVVPAGTPVTINPTAAAYIQDIYSKISLPNGGPGAPNLLTSSATSEFNFRQELVRLDYNYNENLAFAFRFINDSIPTKEPGGLFTNNTVPGIASTKTDTPGRNFFLRASQAFTPNLFNETGISYSYGAINSSLTGLNSSLVSANINPILPFTSSLARVPNVTPGYVGVSGFGPYQERNRNFNIYDNVIVNIGNQALKFGVSFHYYQKKENAGGNNVGTFAFNQTIPIDPATGAQLATTLNAQRWAYFLTGQPSNFTQDSLDATPDVRAKQIEFYAQDDFRVRPNLTLNLGVRYSLFRQPTDKNGNLSNFNPNLFNQANAFQIDANGNRVASTGDPLNGIIIGGQNSPFGDKVAEEDYGTVGPVFGFAWDPFKNGKTAVRGGYAISYDTSLFGVVEQSIFINPPLVNSLNISNPSLGNPAASGMTSTAPLNLRGTSFDSAVPYVQQYSLDVQREVIRNLIIDVGYFGSKGTNLIGIVDLNQVQPGLAASLGAGTITAGNTAALLNALRPYRGFAAINATQNWFNSNYNSLQVGAEKRFTDGSLVKVAYTFSRNLTDAQTDRNSAPQNIYDIASEYGRAAFDREHIFTVNYVYELPFFRDQKGLKGRLLGGWQVSGITTYASGVPFTVTTQGIDPAGLGLLTAGSASTVSARPDMIADPNSGAPHTIAQWFNTGAFALVPAGAIRPGNASRGSVLGPGYGRWDVALARVIKINEGLRLQVRGEMFNMFNHTNPLNINTLIGDPQYGQVTSTRDPRLVQLGLKLNF
jgi:carboxypeptidase family protein/TonB-dependent receptor-like protein